MYPIKNATLVPKIFTNYSSMCRIFFQPIQARLGLYNGYHLMGKSELWNLLSDSGNVPEEMWASVLSPGDTPTWIRGDIQKLRSGYFIQTSNLIKIGSTYIIFKDSQYFKVRLKCKLHICLLILFHSFKKIHFKNNFNNMKLPKNLQKSRHLS